MQRVKFDFVCNGTSYVLWAWKGDYINLGAGAELGIYTGGQLPEKCKYPLGYANEINTVI